MNRSGHLFCFVWTTQLITSPWSVKKQGSLPRKRSPGQDSNLRTRRYPACAALPNLRCNSRRRSIGEYNCSAVQHSRTKKNGARDRIQTCAPAGTRHATHRCIAKATLQQPSKIPAGPGAKSDAQKCVCRGPGPLLSGFPFFMVFQPDSQGVLEDQPLDDCSRKETTAVGRSGVWTLHIPDEGGQIPSRRAANAEQNAPPRQIAWILVLEAWPNTHRAKGDSLGSLSCTRAMPLCPVM